MVDDSNCKIQIYLDFMERYKGRSGIYELMNVDDSVKDLISSDASVDDIRKFARSQGMTTLRESGLKLIFDGITTIEEVVKETVFEDDE